MSFEKAIKHKKTRRKPYKTSSFACLNHGPCSWCFHGRMYNTNKRLTKAIYEQQMNRFESVDQSIITR